MKIKTTLSFAFLLAGNAFCQPFIVHLQHPWASDPQRVVNPPHIISAVLGPAFPGTAMTGEGRDWYTYTFNPATRPAANTEFYFASYIPTQWNATANAANYFNRCYNPERAFNFGDVFYNRNVNEIWIVANNLTSCPNITDVPQALKVAWLFNPWPQNAPWSASAAPRNTPT
jgi:hypothetical protein